MGMDQFPMFRLATLLARQFSSPIAGRIKEYATRHPLFRRALIASTGRAYRAAELRFKMWMLRLGRPPRYPPLSENEAMQVGADIIGEMIIFSLGAAIVVFEVNRQAANKELKELDERSRWVAILVSLEELQIEVAFQQEDLDRLHAALREFASKASPASPTRPTPPRSDLPDPVPRTKPPESEPAPTPNLSDPTPRFEETTTPAPALPKKRRPPHC